MSQKVTVEADLVGEEKVTSGFKRMGDSAEQTGEQIGRMSTHLTALGGATVGVAELGELMGNLDEQTAMTIRSMGALLMISSALADGLEVLSKVNMAVAASFAKKTAAAIADTAVTWAHVIAEKAHATALAVKNALLGPTGWAIIAGAAVAAGAALALTTQIPERHTGGPVLESGPHNLLAGEWVLSQEQVQNISNMGGVTINVYDGTVSNVLNALRRAGIK